MTSNPVPVPDIPNSLWRATACPLDELTALKGKLTTRVAIIGAGFTGCSAALHLSLMGIDCMVLDAGQPGIGASGRNGGQVNPGIKKSLAEIQAVWGEDTGEQLVRIIGDAPDLVFDLIERFNIPCHPVRTGIVQPAYSKKSMAYLKAYGETQASLGAPVTILDHAETARLIGSDFYQGGFLDRRAGSVQPLSYCRGLARAARDSGAVIFGHSPVIKLSQTPAGHTIETPGGTVSADTVLICTNGYTDLIPQDPLISALSKTVIPFYSYKVATDPLPEPIASTVIPENQVVADTRRLLTYFRKDHENRLVMGGAGGPYHAAGDHSYKPIEKRIREIYPDLGNPEIAYRWCGKVGLTMDGVPHVHELGPNIFTGLGYNGRGVAMASMMGKWLATRVANGNWDSETIPVSNQTTIAFHGMRKPVIQLMLHLQDAQDRIEHRFFN